MGFGGLLLHGTPIQVALKKVSYSQGNPGILQIFRWLSDTSTNVGPENASLEKQTLLQTIHFENPCLFPGLLIYRH